MVPWRRSRCRRPGPREARGPGGGGWESAWRLPAWRCPGERPAAVAGCLHRIKPADRHPALGCSLSPRSPPCPQAPILGLGLLAAGRRPTFAPSPHRCRARPRMGTPCARTAPRRAAGAARAGRLRRASRRSSPAGSRPGDRLGAVDLDALRLHLVDMAEVTLRAEAMTRRVEGGIEVTPPASGRTLDALRRMVPAHARELDGMPGWRAAPSRCRRASADGDASRSEGGRAYPRPRLLRPDGERRAPPGASPCHGEGRTSTEAAADAAL